MAGALARKCRWLHDRDNSPWYPTMRLFRQQKLGEWKPVFEEMARELVPNLNKIHTG
jgi:hypothetical protein